MNAVKWDKTITAEHKLFNINFKRIWDYRDLILLFVKRDFVVYYKQTVFGPLWYLIQPICSTIIYLYIFGKLARIGTEGIPEILFYFSGTMLWTYFSGNLKEVSNVFLNNKALFGKIFFPRLVVPIASTISLLIKLGIQFILFLIIYVIYIFNGYHPAVFPNILLLPVSIIWLSILSMGMGMIISSVTTKYRDLSLTLDFLIQLAMYATPIVYPASKVTGLMKYILFFNPVSVPVELFRYSMFGLFSMPLQALFLSFGLTITIFVLGLVLFAKNERDFVDVI